MPRWLRERARVPLTVLVTLVIVLAEFGFLSAVYSWGAPVRGQHTYAVALVSGLDEVQGTRAADLLRDTLPRLESAGIGASDLQALSGAGRALAASPTQRPALLRARTAAGALEHRLASKAHSIDVLAEVVYALLLVLVSLGWMVWFRRLVSRHREMQREVTEQQTARVGEQRLAALVRNASDVVAVLDSDTTITYATSSTLSVLGVPEEELTGRRLLSLVAPEDEERLAQLMLTSAPNDEYPVRLRLRHQDGRLLHVEGSLVNLLADAAVGGFVLTLRDVTDRVALEDQLTHQALHDPLTGLANRRLFHDRLTHALERRRGSEEEIVVLFCDLDDFKVINDSAGHHVGDQVLIQVADRTRAALRTGDTVARLGGDEFAILMEGASVGEGLEIAERLVSVLSAPIALADRDVTVGVSIGLAASGQEHADGHGAISGAEMIRNADVAMYLAKDRGKAGVAVYESRLHEQALEELQLRADLEKAMRGDELVLHYQPTIALSTGQVAGFEALVRWQHPVRGLLSPALFIPTAERTGLVVPLGRWVLRAACAAAATMQTPGRPVTMSVNVAAAQLDSDTFCDDVRRALADTGLPPECLMLEITESMLLRDLDAIIVRLEALRALRVRIAIDDFGTGYSSLSYLRRLPVDVLKVDKAFVDNVTDDEQDASLAHAIIAMSHSLKLATIAEGVEQTSQADWLTAAHCSFGQGYLWSRPVPLGEAHRLLAADADVARPPADDASRPRAELTSAS